jgi:hypothetical protein
LLVDLVAAGATVIEAVEFDVTAKPDLQAVKRCPRKWRPVT